MSRALRRARMPVWYTQGFNPHPYITFALPLSLGFESDYEIMDLKLDTEVNFETLKERLAEQMPRGLEILDVREPVMKASEIAFAKYRVDLLAENEEQNYDMDQLLEQEYVRITKTTKSGSREIDIKGFLKDSRYTAEKNKISLTLILPASSSENINPGCVSEAFEKYLSIRTDRRDIRRLMIYNDRMQEFV